ncbi:MAG: Rv3235 family protein [Bifidobacterium crudilactis]|jgi:hypothetical protein|uniref:Rv3235 family protein n=1 Tax=Bifidobacterium crudilactis TaxID=327277 RepID=UPI002352CEA4|nr:Rv3235 family protein [Bifidobacterium crudilactis]MCI1217880.1 hypothetical protein [Bifidobacterium crudilactis]MCI1636825.1 hypothetical protein [Bifidobacterium crudilactis]
MGGITGFRNEYGIATAESIVALGRGMLPVSMHIARCAPSTLSNEQCQGLSVSACRLACMALDVTRGRLNPRLLQRAVDAPIIHKLEILGTLLSEHLPGDGVGNHEILRLPVVARDLETVLVSPQLLEVVVHMNIGRTQYWANVIMRHRNGRWICTMLDVG